MTCIYHMDIAKYNIDIMYILCKHSISYGIEKIKKKTWKSDYGKIEKKSIGNITTKINGKKKKNKKVNRKIIKNRQQNK
jgi:hypothetical protein